MERADTRTYKSGCSILCHLFIQGSGTALSPKAILFYWRVYSDANQSSQFRFTPDERIYFMSQTRYQYHPEKPVCGHREVLQADESLE